MIAWGSSDVIKATSLSRAVPAAAALCLIFVLAAATTRYLQYWQNGVTLLTHATIIAGSPDPALEEFLADELASTGRMNEAYQHYGNACVLLPNDATCHFNMAEILFTRHQLRDALQQYQLAGNLATTQEMALSCLVNSGETLLDLGDYETAQIRLAAALQINPTNKRALQLRQQALNQKNNENR
jgi:tetratricopeptide (TPR) repeat protein